MERSLDHGGDPVTGTSVYHAGVLGPISKDPDKQNSVDQPIIEGGNSAHEDYKDWLTRQPEFKHLVPLTGANGQPVRPGWATSDRPPMPGIGSKILSAVRSTVSGAGPSAGIKAHDESIKAWNAFTQSQEYDPSRGTATMAERSYEGTPTLFMRSSGMENVAPDEANRYMGEVMQAHRDKPYSELGAAWAGIKHLFLPHWPVSGSKTDMSKFTDSNGKIRLPTYKAPSTVGDYCANPAAHALHQIGESLGTNPDSVLPGDFANLPRFKPVGLYTAGKSKEEVIAGVGKSQKMRLLAGLAAIGVAGGAGYGLGRLAHWLLNSDKKDEVESPIKDEDSGIKRKALAKAAEEDTRPWRDRVEVYGLKDGKVLGGLYNNDKTHGVFAGGIDPGEDLLQAASREFNEESGYTLKNPRAISTEPVLNEWKPPYDSPKHAERAKQYRGSRTQFVAGDIGDEPPDTSHSPDAHHDLLDVRLRPLKTALRNIVLSRCQSPDLAKKRSEVLKLLLSQQQLAKSPI